MAFIRNMSHPLADYREKHGLTQQELAARLGVSKSAISRWEARMRIPEPRKLLEIAELTGADLEVFLRAEEPAAQ